MLKSIIAGIIAVGTLFGGHVSTTQKAEVKPVQPVQQVVLENGYMVLKDNTPDTSTIVATVEDNDSDSDGYVMAVNKYDRSDEVAIDKMDLRKGDVVLITFLNDDVVKVVRNNLNVPSIDKR